MALLTVVDLPDKFESDISNTPVDPGLVAGELSGDEMPLDGRTILIARNTGAGANTMIITSFPAQQTQRLGDITATSLPAAAIRVFQNFPTNGWRNSNGRLSITVSSVEIELAAIRVASL